MTGRHSLFLPRPKTHFMGRFARVLAAVAVAISLRQAAPAGAEDALKVGVSYVPPKPKITDTRLYTEEGFELELAREIGRKLNRKIELVRVAASDRRQALEEAAVDVTIGSEAEPQAENGRSFAAGSPVGLSVAMRSDTSVRDWSALRGKTVCIAEANERARQLAHRLGASVREERAPARSLMWVRTGECDAAVHEQPLLDRLFSEKNWQKFSATLPPEGAATLSVALAPQVPTAVVEAVGEVVADFNTDEGWQKRIGRWAANVAFEVYLDQEAPDCHG